MKYNHNHYREQNEHLISQNIGQDYTCYKRVTLADLITTSDSSLSNQIKAAASAHRPHPSNMLLKMEDNVWNCFDNVRNSQSRGDE